MIDILEGFLNGITRWVDVFPRIWPFVVGPIALGVFLVTIVSMVRKWTKFARWRKTRGKVVEVKRELNAYTVGSSPGNRETVRSIDKTVVVEFAALGDGANWIFSEEIHSSWHDYHEGDEVEIHYDPRDPQSATLAKVSQNYAGEIIGIFGSLVFFGMFIGSLVERHYLSSDTVKWWVMVLFGILGSGLLLFSVVSVLVKAGKLDSWQSTVGVLLRVETHVAMGEDEDGSKHVEREYSPIVEFTTLEDGVTYVFAGRTKRYKPKYTPGHEVQVLYDPANPKSAMISKFTSIYSAEIWAFVLSLVMLTLWVGLKFR